MPVRGRAPVTPAPTALICTSDKTGLVEFGQVLVQNGWHIYATEGTRRLFEQHGIAASPVALLGAGGDVFGGRVKTLDRSIFAGLLARRGDAGDMAALAACGYTPIDMVVTAPYALGGGSKQALAESIDVGGPAMLRAAAKNNAHVFALADPQDYPLVAGALRQDGFRLAERSAELRRELAVKAFRMLAAYDCRIAASLEGAAPRKLPPPKLTAMVYCRDGGNILLMQRKKQPFVGQWIAPGGKIEPGEAPWQAAARELHEEAGLTVQGQDLHLRGLITETSPRADWQWLMFVYVADRFTGTLAESCPEGDFAWWPLAALATLDIPEADRYFTLPIVAGAALYQASFVYDNELKLVDRIELGVRS